MTHIISYIFGLVTMFWIDVLLEEFEQNGGKSGGQRNIRANKKLR